MPEQLRSARPLLWRRLRLAVAGILMLAALLFIGDLIKPQLALFPQAMRRIDWWLAALAVLACVPMYYIKAAYHVRTLGRFSGRGLDRRKAVAVYLQAQVVRYLPGKIWGLLYQSGRMAGDVYPGIILAANLWQMLITNVLAVAVVAGVLLAVAQSPWWLLLVVLGVAVVEFLHRCTMPAWLSRGRLAVGLSRLGVELPRGPLLPMAWSGTAMLCAEWVFFFAVFLCLLGGQQSLADTLALGAWYGGASVIALAAFVVPAGLAVREAIFVAAPAVVSLDAAHLVLVAALARIVFLGGEIISAVVSALFGIFSRND
ncbi:hypothetical protein GXB84_02650 [Stenotrophomonas acidaminiphila]|uniref:hypothetical protein n=1 Tax=Stenotrophomonas acidaminiphila TaxID=128780 RepID=UPI0013760573|nr:hypothetical protein [Stenotrophomonas acidaminiphila]NCT86230.1 hypothetical protein [Stenotrophomonas acidaminiphila]